MLEGSLTRSTSTPLASIAARGIFLAGEFEFDVWHYSSFRCGIPHSRFELSAGARNPGARIGQRGDGRVLDAGAGEVGIGDLALRRAARRQTRHDLTEFGEFLVGGDEAGFDR